MPRKVLFLGSKRVGYRCFRYLIEKQEEFDIEIIGLLTNRATHIDAEYNLVELARKNGIIVIPDLSSLDKEFECEYLISIQYHQILTTEQISLAGNLAINLHMAPLPEYRGCNQFTFAILNQDEEFGTTLHIMEEGIDSGDIIAEDRFPIPENCKVDELFELTADKSVDLFKKHIGTIFQGSFSTTPQEKLIPERGTSLHFRKEIDAIKILSMDWPMERIARTIRATSMPGYEPPYTMINGKKEHYGLDKNGQIMQVENPHAPIIQHSGIRDVEFGEGVRVVEPVNIYCCSLGDFSFIGPFVEIQKNVSIGNHTKIQSHAFICELVEIGDHCFISHGVMFINDTFSTGGPAGGDKSKWKSTRIGNGVSIGTNSTVLPVDICDNVVIGAGSVVTKDITEPGVYVGNPAKKIK